MKNSNPVDIRDAIFDQIYEIAKKDKNFIFIADDMDAFSLRKFKKDLPKQYLNIGVAEQNMIDVAAGLASTGKTVCCFGIASYVTTRCYEQIKFSICSMNLPVTIIGIGAGFSFNFDGPTHQGTIDLGIMRLLPGMTIYNPSDATTSSQSIKNAYNSQTPTYIRLDKGTFPKIYNISDVSKGYKIINKLSDINIITTGMMTTQLLQILEDLNITSIGLIDIVRLKPLNQKVIDEVIKKSKKIITFEEHSILGGLSTAISELIALNHLNTQLTSYAIQDKQFDVFGTREWLQSLNSLDSNSIKKIVTKLNVSK